MSLANSGKSRKKVDPLRLAINLAGDFQPQAAERGIKIIVDDLSLDLFLTADRSSP